MYSKATQCMSIMMFTLSVLLVDTYVGGWWWSTILFSIPLTLVQMGMVEGFVQYMDNRTWDKVDAYTQQYTVDDFLRDVDEVMDYMDRLWDGYPVDMGQTFVGKVKARPYDWNKEAFHTLDDERVYQGSCRIEDDLDW